MHQHYCLPDGVNTRSGFYISKETSDGLKMTIICCIIIIAYLFTANSFIELVRYLFKVFGCQWQKGGTHD